MPLTLNASVLAAVVVVAVVVVLAELVVAVVSVVVGGEEESEGADVLAVALPINSYTGLQQSCPPRAAFCATLNQSRTR